MKDLDYFRFYRKNGESDRISTVKELEQLDKENWHPEEYLEASFNDGRYFTIYQTTCTSFGEDDIETSQPPAYFVSRKYGKGKLPIPFMVSDHNLNELQNILRHSKNLHIIEQLRKDGSRITATSNRDGTGPKYEKENIPICRLSNGLIYYFKAEKGRCFIQNKSKDGKQWLQVFELPVYKEPWPTMEWIMDMFTMNSGVDLYQRFKWIETPD